MGRDPFDFGPDVRLIDQALSKVFGLRQVDARTVAVCGFSDGASVRIGTRAV